MLEKVFNSLCVVLVVFTRAQCHKHVRVPTAER